MKHLTIQEVNVLADEIDMLLRRPNGEMRLAIAKKDTEIAKKDAEIAGLKERIKDFERAVAGREQQIKEQELLLGRHGDVKQSTEF